MSSTSALPTPVLFLQYRHSAEPLPSGSLSILWNLKGEDVHGAVFLLGPPFFLTL